jgi:hydroxymethylpyrimidine/phosphomethylpyrimidine kinase
VTPRVALTVAGSDSGGGAGLSTDLRTFAAHGLHGVHAITVVTAQNTGELRRAVPLPADLVRDQIEAVLDDFDVGAVKLGMLLAPDVATAVAELAEAGRLPRLVVDPVLVNRRGVQLVADEVVATTRDRLLPVATVTTPNRAEAALLSGVPVVDDTSAEAAAARLSQAGPLVVVTGGSARGDAVDVVAEAGRVVERLVAPRVETANDHGSGCTFAAAVTAGLALGRSPRDAVAAAKAFVDEALRRAAGWSLGAGPGPLDQLGLDGQLGSAERRSRR